MEDDTTSTPSAKVEKDFSLSATTLGGKVRLVWDERVEMSTNAHHVLFSEYLQASGLFERFVREAPLVYTSNNAPEKGGIRV